MSYVGFCSQLINFNSIDYGTHISECKLCQERSPLLNALLNVFGMESFLEIQDLLNFKTVLEIIYNKLEGREIDKYAFQLPNYETYLLTDRCDCGHRYEQKTQLEMRQHVDGNHIWKYAIFSIKFQQNQQFKNIQQIHKQAYKYEILYINYCLSKMILKKQLNKFQSIIKIQESFIHKTSMQNCIVCDTKIQFGFYSHKQCDSIICINCLNKQLSNTSNVFKFCCWQCKNPIRTLNYVKFVSKSNQIQGRDQRNLDLFNYIDDLKDLKLKWNEDSDNIIKLRQTISDFLVIDNNTLVLVFNSQNIVLYFIKENDYREVYTYNNNISAIISIKKQHDTRFITYSQNSCKLWKVSNNKAYLLNEFAIGVDKKILSIENTDLILLYNDKYLNVYDLERNEIIIEQVFKEEIVQVFSNNKNYGLIIITKLQNQTYVYNMKRKLQSLKLVYKKALKNNQIQNYIYFEYKNEDMICLYKENILEIINVRKGQKIQQQKSLSDIKFQNIQNLIIFSNNETIVLIVFNKNNELDQTFQIIIEDQHTQLESISNLQLDPSCYNLIQAQDQWTEKNKLLFLSQGRNQIYPLQII